MAKPKTAAPEMDSPNPADNVLDAPPSAESDPMMGAPDPAAEGPEGLEGPPPPEGEEGAEPDLESHGTGAIQGRYNSSPVGDIKMTKVKGTYNTYKLELSMGQLEVILTALERNHDDAVSDELLATFHFYLEKLPGPGEDEDEFDAKQDAAAGVGQEGDTPLPMPPGSGDEGGAPEDMSKLPTPGGAPPGGEVGLPGDEGEEPPPAGAGGPPPEDTLDKRLPPPPKE